MIPKGLISENSRVQEIRGRIWDDLGGKSCDGFFLKELVDRFFPSIHFPKSLRLQVEILQNRCHLKQRNLRKSTRTVFYSVREVGQD